MVKQTDWRRKKHGSNQILTVSDWSTWKGQSDLPLRKPVFFKPCGVCFYKRFVVQVCLQGIRLFCVVGFFLSNHIETYQPEKGNNG